MINKNLPLILASGSQSRLSLLNNAGFVIDRVLVVDIDESSFPNENPKRYAQRVAYSKLKTAISLIDNGFIITADTTAVCGKHILHKTNDHNKLRDYWKLSSSKKVYIYTAVYCAKVIDKTISVMKNTITTSYLRFKMLNKAELEHYLHSNEGCGKAGGHSILGIASRYIKHMRGSHTNIVGLPMYETTELLKQIGFDILGAKK